MGETLCIMIQGGGCGACSTPRHIFLILPIRCQILGDLEHFFRVEGVVACRPQETFSCVVRERTFEPQDVTIKGPILRAWLNVLCMCAALRVTRREPSSFLGPRRMWVISRDPL